MHTVNVYFPGLAIYNGVILDVKFPTAIYKKLQGVRLGLQDLQDLQPILVRSLQNLLEYEGDLENDFCQTFQVESQIIYLACISLH